MENDVGWSLEEIRGAIPTISSRMEYIDFSIMIGTLEKFRERERASEYLSFIRYLGNEVSRIANRAPGDASIRATSRQINEYFLQLERGNN